MTVFHQRLRRRIHNFTGTGVHRVVASIAMAKEGTVTVDVDAVMRHHGEADLVPLLSMTPTGQHRLVAAVNVSTEANVAVDVAGVMRHRGQADMSPLVGMTPTGQHRLVATIEVSTEASVSVSIDGVMRHRGQSDMAPIVDITPTGHHRMVASIDVTTTSSSSLDIRGVLRHAGIADMVDASQPPSADLNATDTATNLQAEFDASGSTDPDTPDSDLEYRYDPGDGSGWIDHNNDGNDWTSDDIITYTYGSSGTYIPVVEVRDLDGNTDSASSSVTV